MIDRQRGTVFPTTILFIGIIAALGYALNTQIARTVTQVQSVSDRMRAQYLAQAGLRHHLWQARTDKGGTYTVTVSGRLVDHGRYRSVLLKDLLSNFVVHITSTGTTPNGTTAVLKRSYTLTCSSNLKTTIVNTFDNKGSTVNIFSNSNLNSTGVHFALEHDPDRNLIKRALMRFAPSAFPIAGTTIASAKLLIDMDEHDPAMDGGQMYANRLLKTFTTDKTNWTNATSNTDKWATPGGDYTLVNAGTATIASGITTYNFDITAIVDGWINGSVTNNGLLLRTNIKSGTTTARFRLNALTPRIEIQHCG